MHKGSHKRKSFVEPVGRMNSSNFKNETFFLTFTSIITTRNGWDGTNFYIGNWMVSSIKMSRNRLVNILKLSIEIQDFCLGLRPQYQGSFLRMAYRLFCHTVCHVRGTFMLWQLRDPALKFVTFLCFKI